VTKPAIDAYEHTVGAEQAEHSRERIWVRSGGLRQFGDGNWDIRDEIGDSQFSDNLQATGDKIAAAHQLYMRDGIQICHAGEYTEWPNLFDFASSTQLRGYWPEVFREVEIPFVTNK